MGRRRKKITILAIDPGSHKCGIAVVTHQGQVLVQLIAATEHLATKVEELIAQYPIAALIVGNRTKSKAVRETLRHLDLPVELVDEHNSTLEGRVRFLKENTRGLARLLPIGLRIPARTFDDYVAVVLAERYFLKIKGER